MDDPVSVAAQFLRGIWATSGTWGSIGWLTPGKDGMNIRSWKISDDGCREAAVFALDLSNRRGYQVYHALPSFHSAVEDRPGYWKAPRQGANAELIKTLVLDADVKREGDNKAEAQAFATQADAMRWMKEFIKASGMPPPNRAVSSGYGVHFYWVLDEALPPAQWQPLADALSAAVLAHGWTQDTKSTKDVVRVLRPPGTANYKAGTNNPAAVYAIDKLTAPDYANERITSALASYTSQRVATGTHGASATVHNLGPRPGHIPNDDKGAGLNQAAHEGIERREFYFERIAQTCAQVKLSLETHGKDDTYPVWYLGNLTLTTFCVDGDNYPHELSSASQHYNPANFDAWLERAKQEIHRKQIGAPRCSSYNSYRPGICDKCPFFGKINSPISTGAPDGDLPPGYRRNLHRGWPQIEYWHDHEWRKLVDGDVYMPHAYKIPSGGFSLVFSYELGSVTEWVSFRQADAAEPAAVFRALERQGFAPLLEGQKKVIGFLMAWITQLRKLRAVHHDAQHRPFGWNRNDKNARVGLAIAGDHYHCDGEVDKIPGGDPRLNLAYTPLGSFENWRAAAQLFEGKRPDLQTIIACSFASALFALAGDIRGVSWNFWSVESGIGKTTALKVGQTVWGDVNAISNLNDTPNAVMKSLSEPRVLTRFWDELRLPTPDRVVAFVDMVYAIPQGREKARMQSDTSLRETGEWNCAVVFTSNRSQVDHLYQNNETDSGAQRLFEVQLPKEGLAYDATAGQKLKLLETNHGHAGRRYAQWVAQHADEVEARLAELASELTDEFKFQREERFFAAAMVTTLGGAEFARDLGLFDFDLDGIRRVLKTALFTMREQLAKRSVVSRTGGYRIEDLVSQFVVEQADYRIKTDKFAAAGGKAVRVLAKPARNEVRLHVAIAEQPNAVLRISRTALNLWLTRRQIPTRAFADQLQKELGASECKRRLAGATEFSGPQIWCFDIPMTGSLGDVMDDGMLLDVGEGASLG